MPRKRKGNGSTHKLKSGKWRSAVTLNGKRVSRTFATKALAEKWRMEMNSLPDSGKQALGQTFGGVVGSWLKHIEATKDPKTFSTYEYSVRPFAHLNSEPTEKIATFALQAVIDGLTGRKAQLAHDKLKQCFKWADKMGMVLSNPTSGLERPQHDREAIEVFSADEVATILKQSNHLRHAAAIRLALSVGLRGGEVWGLQWDDWDGDQLAVNRQAAERAGHVTIKPPKKNSKRVIPLSDSAIAALESRNKARLKEGLASSSFIFPDTKGNPIRRTKFAVNVWKPLLKRCGLESRGFHHCRHTCATLSLNAGVPVTVVSALLGHKDASTTLSIYSHLITSELHAHRNTFDDLMRGREAF